MRPFLVPYLNPYQIVSRRRLLRQSDGIVVVLIIAVIVLILITACVLLTDLGCGEEEEENTEVPYSLGLPRQRVVSDSDTFQLVQANCTIPLAHKCSLEYNQSNIKRLDPSLDQCLGVDDVAELFGNFLYLKSSSAKGCCVREISRSVIDPLDSFTRSKECHEFVNGKLDVSKMEFLEVVCNEQQNGTMMANPNAYREFHARVSVSKKIKLKTNYWATKIASKGWSHRSCRPPSIFLMVIDSTSRTEAYRSLPKTMDFLVNKLGFVDFKGHHPWSESSVANAIALLTGHEPTGFYKKFHTQRGQYWDSAPFIWKEFDRMNYITGYFEDKPRMGTFNWDGQRGFAEKPTDLYLRPLMLAHETVFSHHQKTICFARRTMLQFFLDYTLTTLHQLQNVPSFIVSWPAYPWHQIEQSLSLQDEHFLKFFGEISNEDRLLENMWIIVTSDHAYFSGTYAKTHEGLVERRSIPLLIKPPNNAVREEPSVVDALLWNSEIVTGHLDVYRTMLQIAKSVDTEGLVEGSEVLGQSLFRKLNPNRTCEEAGIPELMCGCNLPVPDQNTLASQNLTKAAPLVIPFAPHLPF